ncbi:MAG: hypothetical protein JJU45_20115 [Acidimicrobiia bacterium]|nr:hypothetical protein [Acidimicrobiia bacterium]
MTLTEAKRPHLLSQLEQSIGKEAAMTLAEHLPPVGWADVATTRDLDRFAAELRAELHGEIQGLRAEFYRGLEQQTRHHTTVLIAGLGLSFTANAALMTVLLHLWG